MAETSRQVSDAHLIALGNIVVSFQFLESIVRYSLGALVTRNTELADHLLAGIGFREMLDMLGRVAEQRSQGWTTPQEHAFRLLVRRIRKAGERRNELMHSEWYPGELEDIAVRYKAKRSASYNVGEYKETTRDLEAFERRLSDLAVRLVDQMESIGVPLFAQAQEPLA